MKNQVNYVVQDQYGRFTNESFLYCDERTKKVDYLCYDNTYNPIKLHPDKNIVEENCKKLNIKAKEFGLDLYFKVISVNM